MLSRFENVDFASASGLQRWMHLLMHVCAYDINCQYCIKLAGRTDVLVERLKKDSLLHIIRTNIAKLWPWTLRGVGKFHLPAHRQDCRAGWSFNLLPGSAMTDGEAAERVWSSVNHLALRTREMNPGHRHDVMNAYYSDQNIRRVHNMRM